MKTTNYRNTFIEVAEDCPVGTAEAPPVKGKHQTIANLQYDLIATQPYQHTSDDVIFTVHAIRNAIPDDGRDAARETFFSKGQPCLRSSPLAKRYGWGMHHDAEGKVALVAIESGEYQRLATAPDLNHGKAMRSKRA